MSRFNASMENKSRKVMLSSDSNGLIIQIDGHRIGILIEAEVTNNGDIIKIFKTDGEVNNARQESELDPVLIITETGKRIFTK